MNGKADIFMDKEYYLSLAKIRLEDAKQLLEDAQDMLEKESYKSANNRAFYAMEKGVKALLAHKEIDVHTHNGALSQFNYLYVHKGDGTFTKEDYDSLARASQIRSASDYDDFYIVSKKDTKQQIEDAQKFIKKVEDYFQEKDDKS